MSICLPRDQTDNEQPLYLCRRSGEISPFQGTVHVAIKLEQVKCHKQSGCKRERVSEGNKGKLCMNECVGIDDVAIR